MFIFLKIILRIIDAKMLKKKNKKLISDIKLRQIFIIFNFLILFIRNDVIKTNYLMFHVKQ